MNSRGPPTPRIAAIVAAFKGTAMTALEESCRRSGHHLAAESDPFRPPIVRRSNRFFRTPPCKNPARQSGRGIAVGNRAFLLLKDCFRQHCVDTFGAVDDLSHVQVHGCAKHHVNVIARHALRFNNEIEHFASCDFHGLV
jgi:hypothetical protein